MSTLSRRTLATLVVSTAAAVTLSACGADESSSGDAASEPMAAPNVIIDVRTPEEFAEGHIEGAVNIDVSSDSFGEAIAALDMTNSYGVYCRSGNRSAQAVARMEEAGFTDVHDLGGLKDAAETLGLEIVTT
ncbi:MULTISPECIES: rhodanese-like domain-containing protein [Actinomyces]|uniref:Rhodanese-like domain-containing protein n=1 Tax=Actinomyces respiraculi TaxID=2744574 RepID=A0A7T0LKE0_9ACTO|nr:MULTISPECIES: rhodanese-like domain-containing protein [Actinomyces]QPL05377.1 rhodanese-like domain-containing protein [Actinomyces respiraculi]